jgi:hypothetical protein
MATRSEQHAEISNVVVPLFAELGSFFDPLEDLLEEAQVPELVIDTPIQASHPAKLLVGPSHFPEQAVYILEKQIAQIGQSMARIKFYLDDLDDLLPR